MRNLPVSIILAAYNEQKLIIACISSLQKQDYKPLEIIVVDDGSTDKTGALLQNLAIRYVKQPHEGTAKARNLGAEQAYGDILVFLDADMVFEENFITQLVKPINEEVSNGTFSPLEYVGNWDKPLARCWNRNNPALPDKLRVPQSVTVGEDFRAILKSEFIKVRGFDDIGYTDTWTLAQKLGYEPTVAPQAVYYHANPETYREVFQSAQWIGKRRYKLGILGSFFALIRSGIVVSLLKGIIRAIRYREVLFLPFQVIYDLGITKGVLESLLYHSVKK